MTARTKCPYCAEEIHAEAVRCPYCRSRLATFAVDAWHRDHPEALVAGVSVALARAFSLPLVAVRAAFVLLSFAHFLGVIAYMTFWLLIPGRAGAPSALEDALGRAQRMARAASCRDNGS